jgi:hypothetical protein
MTLLDAPKFDEVRDRRLRWTLYSAVSVVIVALVVWWLVAGRPVDWPWNWNNFLFGRAAANRFLTAVEKNDLAGAYGIWIHDKDWQQHQAEFEAHPFDQFQKERASTMKLDDISRAYADQLHDKDWQRQKSALDMYPFSRFQQDWSSTSSANEYGSIQSHKIVAARMWGSGLLMAILINGRKSDALDLDYDPKSRTLSFSPPGVELYLGP